MGGGEGGGFGSIVLIDQCGKGIVKMLLIVSRKLSVYIKGNMMAFFVISTFKVLLTFILDLSQHERWIG